MKLLSATVRNYRIHRETTVEFSDALNLIGGKNESGKSTLAEAIHRALFLKSTTGGRAHEEMQSTLHSGNPEVEVHFSAGGKTWRLSKLFAKGKGTTSLSEDGGTTLTGAEAESKLAALIQVAEPTGGAGGVNQAKAEWAHLWVWQGTGGKDPSHHASSQRDTLLSRLKEEGGGAAMQSELDASVAAHFQRECDRYFTSGGKIKAGSPLQFAQQEVEDATAELTEAEQAFSRLETAARQVRETEEQLAGGDKQLEAFRKELAAAREREKKAAEIQHQIEKETQTYQSAADAAIKFLNAEEEVARLASEIQRLEKAPSGEALTKAEAALTTAKLGANEAEKTFEAAEAKHAELRERRELAEAWGNLLKNQDSLASLEAKKKKVYELEKKKQALDETQARLPAIDEAAYRNLQAAEESAAKTAAVLEAMSTGVKILKADPAVTIGDELLSAGDSRILDRETEISLGDSCRVRVTPGGGSGLEDARSAARKAGSNREENFRKAGVEDLSKAGEVRAQRLAIEEEKANLEKELAGLQADDLDEEIRETSQQLATYDEEVKRRSPRVENFSPPDTVSAARGLFASLVDEISAAEAAFTSSVEKTKSTRAAVESAEASLEKSRQAAREDERALQEARTTLKIKSEPLGAEKDRSTFLAGLEKAKAEAEAQLDGSQKKLTELLPESIQADIERLSRAESEKTAALSSARELRASAAALLRNDGTLDPSTKLATARARVETAHESHQSIERHANAIRLLRDRFADEQQQLSEQFSQPLADAVTGYLRQIFGPDAKASVSIDDGKIGKWQMSRDKGTFGFDDLSGGTREQVAAAVRLAIAELLATDHGGTLPIVFDDAFTNSDPERIRSLHRMLDLASRNGVQVIVLTCTPEEYEALGAKTVSL